MLQCVAVEFVYVSGSNSGAEIAQVFQEWVLCMQQVALVWGGYDCRLLKMIGLFCRISSLLQGSFAKETCNFKEPTNRSHPIYVFEERGAYMFCI